MSAMTNSTVLPSPLHTAAAFATSWEGAALRSVRRQQLVLLPSTRSVGLAYDGQVVVRVIQ